jgi:hypothetical protein
VPRLSRYHRSPPRRPISSNPQTCCKYTWKAKLHKCRRRFCPTISISMKISAAVHTYWRYQQSRLSLNKVVRHARTWVLLRRRRRHFMQPYRLMIAVARLRVSRSRGLGGLLPDEIGYLFTRKQKRPRLDPLGSSNSRITCGVVIIKYLS